MKSIPTNQPISFPKAVRAAIQTLSQHGYVVYPVGGCVRNFLMGLDPKDYDLATDATPDVLERLFPQAVLVGKAFGVIQLPADKLEISTFRKDLEYRDHRHPAGVVFSNAEEDARRRDFTINGLFYDPKTHRILDYVGGMEDLQAKIVRAIGDPLDRFDEDALRILRAIRFTTRFEGFTLEQETEFAVKRKIKLLKKVSSERIRDELMTMFRGPQPMKAVSMLQKSGGFELLFPGQSRVVGKVLKELLSREEASDGLIWAGFLCEFNGVLEDRDFQSLSDRFKFSKEMEKKMKILLHELPKFAEVFEMREANLQRFIRQPYFEDLCKLEEAWVRAHHGDQLPYVFALGRYQLWKSEVESGTDRKMNLITGKDLIDLGFQPGPLFREILEVVENLALEARLHSREEALDFVLKNFA